MQENKVVTTETLRKIKEKFEDKTFKDEFNSLFKQYINYKNNDKNAHYHAILKLLQSAGLDKNESENFFKNLRVKNSFLIDKVQEIQKNSQKIDEKWKNERMNLLTNPTNFKALISVVITTFDDILNDFKLIEKNLELQFANSILYKEKLKEVENLLLKSKKELEEIEKDEDVLAFNNVIKNLEQITQNTQEIVSQNIISNSDILLSKDQELGLQGEKENDDVDDVLIDDDDEIEEKQNVDNTNIALQNCLDAVMSSLDKEVDKKTLNFLVLSEFLHGYRNEDTKELYNEFKNVFDKDEFKNVLLYNVALQNNDVEDVFDFVVEEGFEAIKINDYAKMLTNNFNEYKELEQRLNKEINNNFESTTTKEKNKEFEINQPQKKLKKHDEIGI